ncbi:pirin family protein [Dyadobacter fanqingshengii]|uniref:Quercetin 2,3-dioxygenase C-terminal cupin domain-containing protein n=2 Tax=Dyadobacter TaxID=120831 RepID=A0A9X1PFV4_9BACT|nr:hypothetical protein [Dyadobacter fanqingshengii]MCF0043690.1 hypothetical protein [Dyadobacter fanqingshengii]USJ34938.2 hypothetical protein NFI81_19810 [Dyadobacter fanqingshengii]
MITAQMDIEAQIFLQSQRGRFQSNGFRGFYTFNFGDYQAENREPIGKLLALNDETLLPQCSWEVTVNEPVQIILLPLVGAVEINEGKGDVRYVDSGECLSLVVTPNDGFLITNPYPDQAINYLQIRLLDKEISLQNNATNTFDLNIKNTLIPILDADAGYGILVIGKYQGRKDGLYISKNPANCIFIFIIEGAFEVQNRLLEKRDGLSLKNVPEVEFEALSNDAIILILETEN